MKSKNFELIPILPFQKQAKKLIKKYPSLKSELLELFELLKADPIIGVNIGSQCYKIRLAISSKNKGKSAGARVIINVFIDEKEVYLLSIYDKSEKSSISEKELKELIKWINT
ncbi:type II toxin-antitoxin system RelE/ParE family toxin [Lacihabitans soyangensis]|uniref:Addiction module toxin RelE n=1 Tax=Lacihabitans soyangensis TaxID=869394 RepID=A0AAE3KSS7_9BACT|nr:type II toxin-antitoxin system RelE/ParE family toxin [Lacihabitans soyangensis]MCP9763403.1 hypothetical protein [Lacihabitans soyangensis]